MRAFFWFLAILGLVLTLAYFFFPTPLHPSVTTSQINDKYVDMMTWTAIIGAVIGLLSGLLARGRIRHIPHEHARDFLGRVGAWGVSTEITACVLALVVMLVFIAVTPLGPLSVVEKLELVVPAGKFLSLLGAGVLVSAFLYVVVTVLLSWGGRYALIPNRT